MVPTASHMHKAQAFRKKIESRKAALRDVKSQDKTCQGMSKLENMWISRVLCRLVQIPVAFFTGRVSDDRSAPYWLPETLGRCYRKRHVLCHVVAMDMHEQLVAPDSTCFTELNVCWCWRHVLCFICFVPVLGRSGAEVRYYSVATRNEGSIGKSCQCHACFTESTTAWFTEQTNDWP